MYVFLPFCHPLSSTAPGGRTIPRNAATPLPVNKVIWGKDWVFTAYNFTLSACG